MCALGHLFYFLSKLTIVNEGEIDIIVVRENTEGEYANVGGFQYRETEDEIALQTAVFTRKGTERIPDILLNLLSKKQKINFYHK